MEKLSITYVLDLSLPYLRQGEDTIDTQVHFSGVQWSTDSGQGFIDIDLFALDLGIARELQ